MVILRSWAEATLSPGPRNPRQVHRPDHNTEDKDPHVLLRETVLMSPAGVREATGHQVAQTLLSAQATGPLQAAPPTQWDTPLPSSPAARALSSRLFREKGRAGLASSQQGGQTAWATTEGPVPTQAPSRDPGAVTSA